MSINVYPNNDDWKAIFHKMCTCGHELYQHGNTLQYDYQTSQQYLRVSGCIRESDCGCREFNEVEQ